MIQSATAILEFRPSRKVFVRNKIMAVLAWSLVIGLPVYGFFTMGLGVSILPNMLDHLSTTLAFGVVAIILVLGSIIMTALHLSVFGELSGWATLQHESWQVFSDRIVIHKSDTNEQGQLLFQEVASVHKHFPNSIRMRLHNGQAVVMQYLDNRDTYYDVLAAQLSGHPA